MLVNKIIIMEKLEFKNHGLRELSSKELRETEGGIVASIIAGILVGLLMAWRIKKKKL